MNKIRFIILILSIMILISMAGSCTPAEDEEPLLSGLGITFNVHQEYGGWIYFIDYNTTANLYRVKSNGEKRTLIIDEPIYSFVIYEDRIFYINNQFYLYSSHLDGSEDKMFYSLNKDHLVNDPVRARKLQIENDWIYILNGLKFYKIKTDGTDRKYILTEKDYANTCAFIQDFCIESDNIYYLTRLMRKGEDGRQLWQMNTDGTKEQKLMQEASYAIDYDDTWIYFADNDGIFKSSFDGNEKHKIADCSASYIKVMGDWIYYRQNIDIYKIRTDGTENTFIATNPAEYFSIFDQWFLCYGNELSAIKLDKPSETEELTYDIISKSPKTTIYD